MKFLKIALAATAVSAFAMSAQAQDSGAYINIGVDAVEFDSYNLGGKVGYNFNEMFGLEGQASIGIIDDKTDVLGDELKSGIDSSFAAFGTIRFPASDTAELFARAGYHFTQVGESIGNFDVDYDLDGFAVGAGGQVFFTPVDGIRVEYTYFDGGDEVEIEGEEFEVDGGGDTFSISYVRKF